ncbi:MAG TPA: hypothetical protein VGC08_10120 [Pedobacter sp.]
MLAHIGLVLVLDHLLLTRKKIDPDLLYVHLHQANSVSLEGFLRLARLPDQGRFTKFLDEFISSRYLFSYKKIENITYSLNRICMRLWKDPLAAAQLDLLTLKLEEFKEQLENKFLIVFDEIEEELNKNKY